MSLTPRMTMTASCDHEWFDEEDGCEMGCTESDTIRLDLTQASVEEFCRAAKEEFERRGWTFFGGTKCPRCVEMSKEPGHIEMKSGGDR